MKTGLFRALAEEAAIKSRLPVGVTFGLFRVGALGAVISSLVLGTGCGQKIAQGEVPAITSASATSVDPAEKNPALNADQVPVSVVIGTNVVETPAAETPATNAVDKDRVVQGAVTSGNVSTSPGLQEVIKMFQGGVSEEVILSYVTNSASSFGVGSDQIIYLHDLGLSSTVTKALIQHDSAAETLARQQAGTTKTAAPGTTVYPGGSVVSPNASSTTLPLSYEETKPVTTAAPAVTTTQTQTPVTVNYFYDYLSPYGRWVEVEGYGLCWQPTVAVSNSEWRPYSDEGYWLWSDNGWYWYSYYSWGWAPFHYGRWSHRPRVGWVWAPDIQWGPAWVSWRESGDYCGWAPLPPEAIYVSGVGLHYRGAAISVGFDFGLSDFYYTFIPTRHFGERRPHPYFLPRHRAEPIFHQSLVMNNYVLDNRRQIVNRGIGFDRINAAAPGRVPRAVLHEAPLGPPTGPRPEHLEFRGGGVVVHRPVLPRDPPPPARMGPVSVTPPSVAPLPPPGPGRGNPPPRGGGPGGPGRPGGPGPGREPMITTPLPRSPGPSAELAPGPRPEIAPHAPPPGTAVPRNPSVPPPGGNRLATMVTRPPATPAPAPAIAPPSGPGTLRPGAEPGTSPSPRPSVSPPSSSASPPSGPGMDRRPVSPGSAGNSPRGTVVLPPIAPQRMEPRPPSAGPPSSRSFPGSSPAISRPAALTPPPSYSPGAPARSSGPSSPPPSASAPPPSRGPSAPAPSYSAPPSRGPSGSPPPSYSAPPASRSPPSGPPPSGGGGASPGGRKDDNKR